MNGYPVSSLRMGRPIEVSEPISNIVQDIFGVRLEQICIERVQIFLTFSHSVGLMSYPTAAAPIRLASTRKVPLPKKGSSTVFPLPTVEQSW